MLSLLLATLLFDSSAHARSSSDFASCGVFLARPRFVDRGPSRVAELKVGRLTRWYRGLPLGGPVVRRSFDRVDEHLMSRVSGTSYRRIEFGAWTIFDDAGAILATSYAIEGEKGQFTRALALDAFRKLWDEVAATDAGTRVAAIAFTHTHPFDHGAEGTHRFSMPDRWTALSLQREIETVTGRTLPFEMHLLTFDREGCYKMGYRVGHQSLLYRFARPYTSETIEK